MDIILPYGTVIAYAGKLTSLGTREEPLPTELIHLIYPQRHTGWFLCNGAPMLKSRYWNLFHALQFIYGKGMENSNTVFKLPDYTGQFLRGLLPETAEDPSNEDRTQAAGPDAEANGVGSTQENMVQKHEHQYNAFPGAPTPGKPEKESALAKATVEFTKGLFVDEKSISGSETRPKNTYVNYLIYAGLPQ